ncbi:MAG: hypothetical protein ACXWLE_01090 [Rhizomicrobium sp.]
MQNKKTFGRRPQPELPRQSAPTPAATFLTREDSAKPTIASLPAVSDAEIPDVDRELEEWKTARKVRKRSFREPWRSMSIAATIGFGVSSWLLPDSVADVAQVVTAGLGAASFFAGIRGNWHTQSVPHTGTAEPQT